MVSVVRAMIACAREWKWWFFLARGVWGSYQSVELWEPCAVREMQAMY